MQARGLSAHASAPPPAAADVFAAVAQTVSVICRLSHGSNGPGVAGQRGTGTVAVGECVLRCVAGVAGIAAELVEHGEGGAAEEETWQKMGWRV